MIREIQNLAIVDWTGLDNPTDHPFYPLGRQNTPRDDNAKKAAKALISEALKDKQERTAFQEVADRIEGKVKEKVVYIGGEQKEGDRPVVLRVEYAREETPRHEISCDSKT